MIPKPPGPSVWLVAILTLATACLAADLTPMSSNSDLCGSRTGAAPGRGVQETPRGTEHGRWTVLAAFDPNDPAGEACGNMFTEVCTMGSVMTLFTGLAGRPRLAWSDSHNRSPGAGARFRTCLRRKGWDNVLIAGVSTAAVGVLTYLAVTRK